MKMCHTNNEKRKTTNCGRDRTTKSRKIRTFGEKENYKNFGILEADTIKEMEMEEKNNKSISEERKNCSKTKYIAEISSKV